MLGISEEQARRQITDRLDPHGGRLLEVSIGTGANLPCLVDRLDVGEVFGMDLSSGQLRHCQGYLRRHNWQVELFQGNAEQLPFKDASFASVLHVGGINFFNDRRAAILEMIRVAEPGARILIADETEKGARGYEKTIPGFKSSFKDGRKAVELPIHLVPVEMLERRISEIWKGWFYCIEFRKPL
jgi:ubiquinone/menaquinone biosynthesis C-methylase UbiE